MTNEKTFKTKTGFCHVLPDKIVLTRDGVAGTTAKVIVGNTISRILVIYGGLAIWLLYIAFDRYRHGQNIQSLLSGLVGLYLVYAITRNIRNSATPVIDRDKIRSVKFIQGITGLTRSRFEVLFEEEPNRIKKRLILLPGSLTDGKNETEKALRIMTEEKMLTTL
jgi:hypothetical protein